MTNIIKINGREQEITHLYDLIEKQLQEKDIFEFRVGEFFYTKKHFVRSILSLSKLVKYPNKIDLYILALRMQFTDLYDIWLRTKISQSS